MLSRKRFDGDGRVFVLLVVTMGATRDTSNHSLFKCFCTILDHLFPTPCSYVLFLGYVLFSLFDTVLFCPCVLACVLIVDKRKVPCRYWW